MIERLVKEHPALESVALIDSVALPPIFGEPFSIQVDGAAISMLAEKGIEIVGPAGHGNWFHFERQMAPIKLRVNFNGTKNNQILIEGDSRLRGNLIFEGDGHLVYAGGASDNEKIIESAVLRGTENALLIGRRGSLNRTSFWIEGRHKLIAVGDDPLFAWNIYLRNADSHGIIDLASKAIINKPESIIVGMHVWIGQDAKIMKGVSIGMGSIIGAGSIVTKSIPGCCSAAGVPARVLRSGVSWTRFANPDQRAIDDLLKRISI